MPAMAITKHDFAVGTLCLMIGFACIYSVADAGRMWWKARAWQAVEAHLVDVELVKKSGFRSLYYQPTMAYTYSVGGAQYTGSQISLGWFFQVARWDDKRTIKKLHMGQAVTVWVNPRQPAESVFQRTFGWYGAMAGFFGGMLALFFASAPFRWDRELSQGPTIPPEPESWGAASLALLWNLMALPFAVIAVLEGRFWPLLPVLFVAIVGIAFAVAMWKTRRGRWQLGPPMLVIVSDGSSRFNARFLFGPGYGGEHRNPEASLEFRQVMYRGVYDKNKMETIQVGTMGTARLENGSRSIDFTAQLPDWPAGTDLSPAYWELALSIGGTCLTYRVDPVLLH
jgi:hypothetical protein